MAESIIGTVLLSASSKRNYTVYHLLFTDSRVLALEATLDPSTTTGSNPLQSLFGSNQLAGTLASMALSGALGGRGMNMNQMAKEQGVLRWNKVKTASQGKPVISYDQKEVTDEMLGLPNVSVQYANIKAVVVKKDMMGSDFTINLEEGMMSSEPFVIQGDAAQAAIELIKKTPLGAKLKQ